MLVGSGSFDRRALHRQVGAERVTQDLDAGRHIRNVCRIADARPRPLARDRFPRSLIAHLVVGR